MRRIGVGTGALLDEWIDGFCWNGAGFRTRFGPMRLTDLIPILQVAIGPVILVSGVGLLLLSMTNRLGRCIDRSRLLAEALRKADAQDRSRFVSQLKVLSRRARLVRLAIILAAL